MGENVTKRVLVVCSMLAGILAATPAARAGYEDEQNAKFMGIVERAIDKFQPNPAVYDGNKFVPSVSVGEADAYFGTCNNALKAWNKYASRVTDKGKRSDRFKKIRKRLQVLEPACKKVFDALKVHEKKVQAQAQARAAAKAAHEAKCDGLETAARTALDTNDLIEVLEVAFHRQTPGTAEHVKDFRTKFAKLVAVCKRPEFKGVSKECAGGVPHLSGPSNARYDTGDICAKALDPQKTLTEVVMRMVKNQASIGNEEPPTVEQFRNNKEGWIHSEDPVYYASYFQVDDKYKQRMRKELGAAFEAAGVPVPADLSQVWAQNQAYLDGLKAAVDATAGGWKLGESKCRGYACKLAKKAIKRGYKKASIKGVYGRSWKIAKNGLGVPTHRYQGMWVIFKVKGEPYCQVRSFTAYENYKGGGKYQKARGARWGYARFQKACK